MVNHVPDATGWMSETAQVVSYNVTGHAGIASLAIIALGFLVAQLLPRSRNPESDEDL
jgi:hypothetical protein